MEYGLVDRFVPHRQAGPAAPAGSEPPLPPPALPSLPALTRTEAELTDRCLDVVDLPGRLDPAQPGDTYRGLRTAQALVAEAAAQCDTLTPTHQRGETEPRAATPARALRVPDGERRTDRVTLPPQSAS